VCKFSHRAQQVASLSLFRLETTDGAPAEPPTLTSAVPDWRPGDTIPLGRKTLRVVGVRDEEVDHPPVLVVEEAS
jgi:hypothetical protein